MDKRIVGFHQDEQQHWLAELECGHKQHVRHDPPWTKREWVTSREGRDSHLGNLLNCAKCDNAMSTSTILKLANAFIPHATASEVLPAFALSAVDRFKRKHGGLWVGGTLSVSQSGVSFKPNGLNRVVHEGLEPINVLGNEIRAVRYEFGWVTGIVVVQHSHGEFRFRCYGAKKFAATMAATFNVA